MLSQEWIVKQLSFLNYRIGLYKLHSGASFFFEPTQEFYSLLARGETGALNYAVKLLAIHLGLEDFPTIVEWKDLPNPIVAEDYPWREGVGKAGMILKDRIEVDIAYKYSPMAMAATLAHELTHYFLNKFQIGYPDTEENERLTEFATVFLGLGKLSLNGYEETKWFSKRKGESVLWTGRFGYLEQSEIAEAAAKICSFRGIPIENAFANLTDKALQLLKEAENRRLTNEDSQSEQAKRHWKLSPNRLIKKLRDRKLNSKSSNGGGLFWFRVGFFGLPLLFFMILPIGNQSEKNPNKEVWKAFRQISYECANEQLSKLSKGYLKMAESIQADIEYSLRHGVPGPEMSTYFEPQSARCRFVLDDLSTCLDAPSSCLVEYFYQALTFLGYSLPPLYRRMDESNETK